jgi:hypothetical protein
MRNWITGAELEAGVYALRRETLERIPMPRPATPTWTRARVRRDCSGIQYLNRAGELVRAEPGELVELDAGDARSAVAAGKLEAV